MLLESIIHATLAHHGQVRNVNRQPYMLHPLRVARLVRDAGLDEAAQAAAVLHDVLEDTDAGVDEFPERVQLLVRFLTKVPGGTRVDSVMKLRDAPDDAVLIKVADRLDNMRESLVTNGVEWMRARWPESTRVLLEMADGRGLGGRELVEELREVAGRVFMGEAR